MVHQHAVYFADYHSHYPSLLTSGAMQSRLALLLAFAMTSNLTAQDSRPSTLAGRSTVYAPRGAIATSQPLATAAGLAVLQRGGNAFDAAVTAAAVLNVVEPHMTRIGGDLFALFWFERKQRLGGLDASGRAGALMTREELLRRGRDRVPSSGAEAITVPGALSGWTVPVAEVRYDHSCGRPRSSHPHS